MATKKKELLEQDAPVTETPLSNYLSAWAH